jgi:glucosyl-3-phosphoglycerate synthase
VDAFSRGLRMASDLFYQDPLGVPLIPSWSRVASAFPGFLQELRSSVEADNLEPAVATA